MHDEVEARHPSGTQRSLVVSGNAVGQVYAVRGFRRHRGQSGTRALGEGQPLLGLFGLLLLGLAFSFGVLHRRTGRERRLRVEGGLCRGVFLVRDTSSLGGTCRLHLEPKGERSRRNEGGSSREKRRGPQKNACETRRREVWARNALWASKGEGFGVPTPRHCLQPPLTRFRRRRGSPGRVWRRQRWPRAHLLRLSRRSR